MTEQPGGDHPKKQQDAPKQSDASKQPDAPKQAERRERPDLRDRQDHGDGRLEQRVRPVTRVIVVSQNDPVHRRAEGNGARYSQQDVWNAVARHMARREAAPHDGRTVVVHAESREALERRLRDINNRQQTPVERLDFVGHGTPNSAVLSVAPRRDLPVNEMGRFARNSGLGRDGAPLEVQYRTCRSGQEFVDGARESLNRAGINDATVRGRSTDYVPRMLVNGAGRPIGVTESPTTDVESRSPRRAPQPAH